MVKSEVDGMECSFAEKMLLGRNIGTLPVEKDTIGFDGRYFLFDQKFNKERLLLSEKTGPRPCYSIFERAPDYDMKLKKRVIKDSDWIHDGEIDLDRLLESDSDVDALYEPTDD